MFSCDACGYDHAELVEWADTGTGPRAFVACPHVGGVPVDPAALRRWAVRLPALASAAASALGATGGTTERVPGRVWKLGTVRAGGRAWTALLAVGLTGADAATVVEAAPDLRAANALVLVPATVPPETIWSADHVPAVVPLTDLLTMGADGLTADHDVLASFLPAAPRPAPKDAGRTFPTPPGATWEQVALVVEEYHVRVQVGDTVERFGFADAGFGDGRAAGAPDGQWALLALLARHRGTLGTEDGMTTKAQKVKQKVGVLRARLRALLALDGDPFHPTGKGQPYRARFAIRPDGPLAFSTPPGATWDDLTLTETRTGIDIAVTTDTRGVAREHADGGEADSRWAGTAERGERHSAYTLADLGLAGAGGDPNPAGVALVALLRAGGRLTRPANAPDLLALGGTLARFFQLDAPPLTFDPARSVWSARFEAASAVPANGQI